MYLDHALPWKNHVEQSTHKLGAACDMTRSFKPFISLKTLKMVYCAYFHSIINYILIFWGNSSHSAKIFKIPMNITGIITGYRSRDSCGDSLKTLKILPLQ
jgi:hypothetical protein